MLSSKSSKIRRSVLDPISSRKGEVKSRAGQRIQLLVLSLGRNVGCVPGARRSTKASLAP